MTTTTPRRAISLTLAAAVIALLTVLGLVHATSGQAVAPSTFTFTYDSVSFPDSARGDWMQVWKTPSTCKAGDAFVERCYSPAQTLLTQVQLSATGPNVIGLDGLPCGTVIQVDVTSAKETKTTLGAEGSDQLVAWAGQMLPTRKCVEDSTSPAPSTSASTPTPSPTPTTSSATPTPSVSTATPSLTATEAGGCSPYYPGTTEVVTPATCPTVPAATPPVVKAAVVKAAVAVPTTGSLAETGAATSTLDYLGGAGLVALFAGIVLTVGYGKERRQRRAH